MERLLDYVQPDGERRSLKIRCPVSLIYFTRDSVENILCERSEVCVCVSSGLIFLLLSVEHKDVR